MKYLQHNLETNILELKKPIGKQLHRSIKMKRLYRMLYKIMERQLKNIIQTV